MTRLSYQWLFWLSLTVIAVALVLAGAFIACATPPKNPR
jgi:hypothetical protein